MCDTIKRADEYNQEENMSSDPRSTERNDVAPMGGVRQDAPVLRWRLDRAGEELLAEAQRSYETNLRGAESVPGSSLPTPTWDSLHKDET